jgi:hypothetical protein
MKAQILKIAGVKSEKAFYKKYPSEEAFMKVHGKEFKKAQFGAYIGGDAIANPKMVNFGALYDEADLSATGMTDAMRKAQAEKAAEAAAKQSGEGEAGGDAGGGMGGMDMDSIMGMFGGGEGGDAGGIAEIASMAGGRDGLHIPKAASGTNINDWWSGMTTDTTTTVAPGFDIKKWGIGAQTMGKLGEPSAPSNKAAGNPVDTSKENWMFKNNNTIPQVGAPSTQGVGVVPNDDEQEDITLGGLTKMAGPLGGIIEGIGALRAERTAAQQANRARQLSDLQLKASTTRPEERERKYVRPEDVVNTGEAFFPIYGVGTNVLARNGARLQDGGMIGGNPTEIQNTYGNGNSLYDDLGYEPLIDYDQQKSFRQGGMLHQLQDGGYANSQDYYNQIIASGKKTGTISGGESAKGAAGGTDWGAISNVASGLGQEAMGGQNAGGQIGGTVGESLGTAAGTAIAGPMGGKIGGAIGNFTGQIAGNALDPYQRRMKKDNAATKKNVQNIVMNQMAPAIQAGYASHMKDGGWVSNDWTPQVIASFGDVTSEDYRRFAHKDEFRAGGHLKSYREPSERAMETFDMGGELQTHWGGYAEPMSYNPYLPGTGQTVMFRGKSHEEYSPNGETGIGITYGGNPVEVERGEPMVELEEGGVVDPETGEVQKSGVVFGNLKIPNQYIDLLGDKSAKGKKFKNYVADLSKTEEKQNKLIEKSTNELNRFDVKNSFDKLKLTALEASIKGGNMKLKEIADKKINAAALQNAINDTAEENGLVADDLARGKVKIDKEAMKEYAKFGGKFTKAQVGGKVVKGRGDKWSYTQAGNTGNPIWDDTQRYDQEWTPSVKTALGDKERAKKMLDYINNSYGVESDKVKKSLNKFSTEEEKINFLTTQGTNREVGPIHHVIDAAIKYTSPGMTTPLKENVKEIKKENPQTKPIEYKRSPLIDIGNQALDYLRPTDQEALDMEQLYPEMYAMSSNQLEPVPAQGYQPELGVPYDISLQDQLNANQADYRAMQRIAGYNPAAQANLNAQKYQANQQVLGTQFRANQEMKDRVYTENRNILNQAKLTNLGIYDKQYERQAQALSNTKATTQAALNSISDKMAKNELENRTLGIYENLYKYRYDKSGRAINMNGIFQPNIPTVGGVNATQKQVPVLDENGNVKYYQLQNKTKEELAAEEEQEDYKAVPSLATSPININIQTKNKKRNGSIVKAIKNL